MASRAEGRPDKGKKRFPESETLYIRVSKKAVAILKTRAESDGKTVARVAREILHRSLRLPA